jgi:predicted GH43/DUF377 family glycosyl hydrolase
MYKLITRFSGNPILTKEDVPYPVATVHNAAVVKHSHEYIMIFCSHRLNGRSILGLARRNDGIKFKVDPKPFARAKRFDKSFFNFLEIHRYLGL